MALVSVFAPFAKADPSFKDLGVAFTNEDGSVATRAGSHPFAWTIDLAMRTKPDSEGGKMLEGDLRDLHIVFPAGLVGTPTLLSRCSQVDFSSGNCPEGTAVGRAQLTTDRPEDGDDFIVYNLAPLAGVPAEFGFSAVDVPVKIKVTISPDPPYNVVASIDNVSQVAAFFGSVLTINGIPAGGPFLTLPRRCDGPLKTIFEADFWAQPGIWTPPTVVESPGLSGCDDLGFGPVVSVRPTTAATQTGSGLDFSLDAPDQGLATPDGIAQADLGRVDLALPEGLTANVAVADGLGACTPADYAREALDAAPGDGCPESAKIGTAVVESPLLEEPMAGALYVAEPDNPDTATPGAENPFDSLLAIYLVLRNPQLGVIVKQAIAVEADPVTGRLAASIENIPQLPFSHIELHFREGSRSPLVTPGSCGRHSIGYRLTPSSGGPPLVGQSSFALDSGCAAPGFQPKLLAGTTKVRAGAASPFVLNLSRSASEQSLSALSLTLPPGVSADFGAVPLCPESRVASGACPAESRVGSVDIVVGAGPTPLPIPVAGRPAGTAYLAGPYRGAPFSLAVVLAARAGPFDLGTVVTRSPIFVDPTTAQARIRLDPLPRILEGVPIDYRAIHIVLDRPDFIFNPTSCAETGSRATVTSVTGTIASASDRFQVGGCGHLAFKPKVSLRLLGPTHRGAHPRLRTVVNSRLGDANIRRAAVTLPGTELLDSRRIGTVCTVALFDAEKCPAGSVYGHAKAWTRRLARPLEGPIYLRASKTRLPELVASLRGQIDLTFVSRVDSTDGRIRIALQGLPDAPLSKVVLTLRGGKRGLLVNTGGVCAGAHRATVALGGQNGKRRDAQPVVRADCR